ncbi:hypothetical protein ACFY36_11045 [Actinoplanes sp. NPDC000266]
MREVHMFHLSRPVALTAAVSMTAVLAGPGAAYAADTATSLSAAEMSAALKTVATASTAATSKGWRATMGLSGSLSATGLFVVDPAAGVVFDRTIIGRQMTADYAVAGKGLYEYLADPSARSALKMMRLPAVKFVFTANKALKLDAYVKDAAIAPSTVLTEDTARAGTKTAHDDGTVDYKFRDESGAAVTMHVDAAGVLASARANDDGVNVALTYTYGPQRVTIPAAPATVSAAALTQGMAYLTMPATVAGVAKQATDDARRASRGHKVKVATLRQVVRRDVTAANAELTVTMVKTKNVTKGVRVYATNPWTRKTVAYTIKASGTKVVLTKNG